MKSITEQTKRKTHTSTEVKKRYNQKTYKRYEFNLRKVEDADLIAYIEAEKEKGLSVTDIIRDLFQK